MTKHLRFDLRFPAIPCDSTKHQGPATRPAIPCVSTCDLMRFDQAPSTKDLRFDLHFDQAPSTKHLRFDLRFDQGPSTKDPRFDLRFDAFRPMTKDQAPRTKNKCPSVPFVVFATVALMIGLQIVAKVPESQKARKKPGPERGDIVLQQTSLPQNVGEWQQIGFKPVATAEEMPDKQWWSVHEWRYRRQSDTAIVSFDQLGWDGWHELTYCYRGQNWTMKSRTTFDGAANEMYVVAVMASDSGQNAVLVFSEFFEDGTLLKPPAVDLDRLNSRTGNEGLLGKIAAKLRPIVSDFPDNTGHDRMLQCQVFLPNLASVQESDIQSTVDLHLETRKHFTAEWRSHSEEPQQLISRH